KPHPTRGWALRANLKQIVDDKRYATNGDGFRSLYEYSFDPERYGVMIVGDSFTFGDGVDTVDTWPNLLSELDARLNVFNLAGSGYGIDQMYLTLTEEIERYKPKLVIAAFIDNNLHRTLLDFRDYKKPRFVLKDNILTLTNTPIEGTETVLSELTAKRIDNYSRFQILNVLRTITGKMYATNYLEEPRSGDLKNGCAGECAELNTRLIEEMARKAKENNAEFMLLYLPRDDELVLSDYKTYGEEFFKVYKAEHKKDHEYLNPREAFLRADYEKSTGHYNLGETKLVSGEVYKSLTKLRSFKKFKSD
ncbi:MAG: SGNH/GDSL hydrolase family protein, partial [Thermodesulfobacteriota bacterium]